MAMSRIPHTAVAPCRAPQCASVLTPDWGPALTKRSPGIAQGYRGGSTPTLYQHGMQEGLATLSEGPRGNSLPPRLLAPEYERATPFWGGPMTRPGLEPGTY
jgi:hypothetical protein